MIPILTVSFFLMSTHNHNDVIDLGLLGYNQHVSSIPLRRRAEELAPASAGRDPRDPRDHSIRSRRPGHAGRRPPTPPSSLIGTALRPHDDARDGRHLGRPGHAQIQTRRNRPGDQKITGLRARRLHLSPHGPALPARPERHPALEPRIRSRADPHSGALAPGMLSLRPRRRWPAPHRPLPPPISSDTPQPRRTST